MATIVNKPTTLQQLGKELAVLLKENTRETLDANYHFIPLNLSALEESIGAVIDVDFFEQGELKPDGTPEKTPEFAKVAISLLKNPRLSDKINAGDIRNIREWYQFMVEQEEKGNLTIPLEQALDIPATYSYPDQVKIGLKREVVKKIQQEIAAYVKGLHKFTFKYNELPRDFETNTESYLPATILDTNGEVIGALYSTFKLAGSSLFTQKLNKTIADKLTKARYADSGTAYKPGFDKGHVIIMSNGKYLATTPLLEKINNLLDKVNGVSTAGLTSQEQAKLTKLKAEIQKRKNALNKKSTIGTRIEGDLNKEFSKTLLKINANLVVIQDRLQNQYEYAQVEGKLFSELDQIAVKLINGSFSRTLLQEIDYRINSIFNGVNFNPSTSKKPLKTLVPTSRKLNTSVTAVKAKSLKKSTGSRRVISVAAADYSVLDLASLMMQINSSLHDQIKANMGTGNRTDVLNYRTGRFAQSAKVERLSESRQGMITAFYTYMKNPYATFSQGGRQELPRSRDPKLLISKSIREIASSLVANRLRAVSL